MRRTKADAAITRDTVLKVALGVFSEKGYSATTLDDIAHAAGVTRGAIYWHYKNKADLYNTLISKFSSHGTTVIQQALAEGGSFIEILRRIFINQLALIEENKNLCDLIELSLYKTEPSPELAPGREQQAQAGQALIANVTAMIQMGIQQGALRSDLPAVDIARSFLVLQNGAIHMWLVSAKNFSLKAYAESLCEIYLNGIAAKTALF